MSSPVPLTSRVFAALAGAPSNILWTVIARAASLAIPILIARRYGAGAGTDTFFLAFGAVNFFVAVGAVVLEQSVVPHAAALGGSGGEVFEWFWKLVRSAALLGSGLAALSWLAIEIAIQIQPRAELRGMLTAARATGVAVIPMLAIISSLSAGVLIGRNRYPLVCMGLLVRTLTAALIVVMRPFGDSFPDLLCAFLGGELFRAGFNIAVARHVVLANVTRPGPASGAGARLPSMGEVWQTTWPVSVSMIAAAMSPIVDRVIAAGIMPGGVSLIEYGEKAYFVVVGTVVAGLQVTALSRWSRRPGDARGVWEELKGLSILIGAAGIVAAPLLFLAGHDVARVIMGPLLASENPATASLTGFYLIAIVPYTLGGLAIRALLARRDTRPLLVMGAVKLGANVIGDIAFTSWIGLPGISLATVLAETCVAVGAFHYARRSSAASRT